MIISRPYIGPQRWYPRLARLLLGSSLPSRFGLTFGGPPVLSGFLVLAWKCSHFWRPLLPPVVCSSCSLLSGWKNVLWPLFSLFLSHPASVTCRSGHSFSILCCHPEPLVIVHIRNNFICLYHVYCQCPPFCSPESPVRSLCTSPHTCVLSNLKSFLPPAVALSKIDPLPLVETSGS